MMSSTAASETRVQRSRSRLRRALAAIAVAATALSGVVVTAGTAHAAENSLHGVVTGADTHEPVQGVEIVLVNYSSGVYEHATTDASGYYSFLDLGYGPDPGSYYVLADDPTGKYVSGYYNPSWTPIASNSTPIFISSLPASNVAFSFELLLGHSIKGELTLSPTPTTTDKFYLRLFLLDPTDSTWKPVESRLLDGPGPYTFGGVGPGAYKVYFVQYSGTDLYHAEFYNNKRELEDAELVVVTATAGAVGIDAMLTPNGPPIVERLAGSDRFQTSARIAQEYSSADVVFVANGLGYPDALSAAPAAVYKGGPLLLTRQNSLPAEVKAEIVRLNPSTIYVVGGTGVISAAVFNELVPLAAVTQRLWGADRYATSSTVFDEVWGGPAFEGGWIDVDVPDVFLADGRNFPDALASASAAGKLGGPVALVNGGSGSVTPELASLIDKFDTQHIRIAGGTAVVSAGIASSADALPGIDVHRYWGANRYATSISVNRAIFVDVGAPDVDTVFLAVGTGYADALSGAALAGNQGGALYLTPGTCVPQQVLDDINTLDPLRVVLLGGTGVLSLAVEALTPCAS
ncbi:putative cell wall-binding protein [Cryobacterium mesophilum]|uniref:Cell wall binding repeat 2 n=1 Tax=Terrimesophilobacter mesophilus TaxID=433647 RepID=A0A4R8VBG5_9MICO|nr:cell wall-binding repeat-containing protein [Terrimesophilobacter mesophilus]MBB5633915.1 putative cell wall-binding protein [Terrimesophilobacter mesophilus]TFB80584.1 hypothetical protein E3N84_11400 [Terrimesophilobacter mesophilus]